MSNPLQVVEHSQFADIECTGCNDLQSQKPSVNPRFQVEVSPCVQVVPWVVPDERIPRQLHRARRALVVVSNSQFDVAETPGDHFVCCPLGHTNLPDALWRGKQV